MTLLHKLSSGCNVKKKGIKINENHLSTIS